MMEDKTNVFLAEFVDELKKGEANAVRTIKKALFNGDIEQVMEFVYKKDNYIISYLRPKNAEKLIENYKKVDGLNLKIYPKLKKIIKNDDGSLFFVSKINSQNKTNVKSFWREPYQNIPKKNIASAYDDLKKMTNAGYKDSSLFNYDECWQLTDNNEIIIPSLYNIEPCLNLEKENIISGYYKILFR